MSNPPQYIPVEELDTENAALVQGGSASNVYRSIWEEWNVLSTALKRKSDKRIQHRCASLSDARSTLSWRGTALEPLGPHQACLDALIVLR